MQSTYLCVPRVGLPFAVEDSPVAKERVHHITIEGICAAELGLGM